MRQIRAAYTTNTITVYQAYSREIAEPALAAGRLVSPFKPDRMTWIKRRSSGRRRAERQEGG